MCRTKSFESRLKPVLKKYDRSEQHIEDTIGSLSRNPRQGDRWPGFGIDFVRKLRVDLPQYKLSPRRGLRLVFLHLADKDLVCLITVRKKGTYQEKEFKAEVLESLKDILQELGDNEPGQDTAQ